MMSYRVLIIHNGRPGYAKIGRNLASSGYRVQQHDTVEQVRQHDADRRFDVLIADEDAIWSNEHTPMQFLKACGLEMPLIVMSMDGSIHNAVQAVRMGACDYLPLSVEDDLLKASVEKALVQQVSHESNYQTDNGSGMERPLMVKSRKMKDLLATARRIAASPATVLIQGESGTGKELLARYIHAHSERASQTFVAMNCAALPENLAESELFGYKRGAFTGAQKDRRGKFELSHGGTLLLDEISEMQLPLQAKLLRVLQEKEIDLIGGNKPLAVDVRCIATSNLQLDTLVAQGKFREDLYYRLCVIPLIIPPLRERVEDIPILVEFFLGKHSHKDRKSETRIAPGAMEKMINWPWPGNVRELENAVQRAVLLCDGPVIGTQALLLEGAHCPSTQSESNKLVGMTVKDLERKLIGQTLVHVNQNRTHAAKMLGISIRTLRNKLREYQNSEAPQHSVTQGK